MDISIDRARFVKAIQNGLTNARNEIITSNTITDNRKHMQKWDYLSTAVQKAFEQEDNFLFVPLDRGLFKPIMIFDDECKILYTIIKSKNFEKLLKRNSVEKIHYIDALLDYNLPYQETPLQMSLFEMENMFSDNAENQICELQSDIEILLHSNKVKKYITIVIDFNGYTLTEIKAIQCSKWLEKIEEDSWNEFITPSYDDIEENGKGNFVQETEIKSKISLKPAIRKVKEIG